MPNSFGSEFITNASSKFCIQKKQRRTNTQGNLVCSDLLQHSPESLQNIMQTHASLNARGSKF